MVVHPQRFGCFLSPVHPIGESPGVLLEQDLATAELADRLGLDEFWIGEHHSGGWSTIPSPELAVAALAHRTRRIRLGTGVVSAPYHHPFMTAQRASMLTHLTQGRLVLGLGAGSLPSDMDMLGIPRDQTAARAAAAAEVVIELLRGGTVSRREEWFTIHEGRVQPLPHRGRAPEITIASAASTAGMELCGRLGVHPLSFGAPPWGTIRPTGTGPGEHLRRQWSAFETSAARFGHPARRERWRVTFPVHVGESAPAARADIEEGWLRERARLWRDTVGLPMSAAPGADRKAFEATLATGGVVLGSPDECVEQIRRLAGSCGGFGTFLATLHSWAGAEPRRRSLELFAAEVVPAFTGETDWLREGRDLVAAAPGPATTHSHEEIA
jgi:limonene 1,2-monooxygenase